MLGKKTSGTLPDYDIIGQNYDIWILRYCLRYRSFLTELRYRIRIMTTISYPYIVSRYRNRDYDIVYPDIAKTTIS